MADEVERRTGDADATVRPTTADGTARRLRVGPRNLITDVPGILVGNAHDEHVKSGTTVLTMRRPFGASVAVSGGAPGTRETDCLAPEQLVQQIDALVLSGGSAFGLDAASAVANELRRADRGFPVGPVRVPIVPAAILFDLLNGGHTDWVDNLYYALGREAFGAVSEAFDLGTAGAGFGATTADLKGGLGSASFVLPGGATVGALVAANPHGSAVASAEGHFHAAPFEAGSEFGGLGSAPVLDPLALGRNEKLAAWQRLHGGTRDVGSPELAPAGGGSAERGPTDGGPADPCGPRARRDDDDPSMPPGANTTIAIVATDAALDKAQLKRLAVAAQDGMARAIAPSHTPLDGDLVFALSSGERALADPVGEAMTLGHVASLCLARAIARGVWAAAARPGDTLPSWHERFGRG